MHTAEQVRITTQQGLPSNYTKSILLANNNLWIGTDNGLCCYNLFHKQIRTFATQPQLANVSFSVNAACQLPDGRLAFGSNNGVVLFIPAKLIQFILRDVSIFRIYMYRDALFGKRLILIYLFLSTVFLHCI